MKHSSFIALILCSLLWSCEQMVDPPTPSNTITYKDESLLENGDFEQGIANIPDSDITGDSIPIGWSATTGPTYQTRWVIDTAAFGKNSLSISSNWVDPAALAFVFQDVVVNNPGKRFRMNARARMENVEGEGIGFEIQGFDAPNALEPVVTFELGGENPILGSSGWTLYTLDSQPLGPSIVKIRVLVKLLRSTTGRAYFDEVKLLEQE